jgi:hypothetical protein
MAGSGWQSVDLLDRFNRLSGRPSSDSISQTVKYGFLADAEQYVLTRIASIAPKVLYGAPTAMTTADGGLTYTFGTDGNGYALFPMGKTQIFPTLSSIPGGAWRPNIDYLDEGIRIRLPNATPYAGPLYWYGLTPAQQMSATVQPVLQPPQSRMLIVLAAVKAFSESAMRNPALADRMAVRFETEFGQTMTMLRTHFKNGGGLGRLLFPWGSGSYGPGWSGQWW